MYENGDGVEQDYEEALEWFRKAAEQGDLLAQYSLGDMYENGNGVEQDYEEALEWFRKAAEQGLSLAQYSLGLMYENGNGVEQDYEEAEKWFRKAAEQGLSLAQYSLGLMYENGDGVEQDYEEAEKWFRKAAEQGDTDAQNIILALMYDNGNAVEQDGEEQDNEEFIEYLAELPDEDDDTQGHCVARETDQDISGNETIDDAMRSLNALIGLSSVKREIKQLIDYIYIQKLRQNHSMRTPVISLHLVFTGNPGTGKTTVARLVGKIYAAIGLLREGQMVEAMRQDLIGEYVGHTAPKVKAKVMEALDGVLFIDEAYALAPPDTSNDFGAEAIATLIAEMENNRDRLAVIVAGYTDEMKRFISMNPGIKSRFTRYIEFDDYSPNEMLEIFLKFAEDADYIVADELQKSLRHFLSVKEQKARDLGNARYVRTLFEKTIERHAVRVAAINRRDKKTLSVLTLEDFDHC